MHDACVHCVRAAPERGRSIQGTLKEQSQINSRTMTKISDDRPRIERSGGKGCYGDGAEHGPVGM